MNINILTMAFIIFMIYMSIVDIMKREMSIKLLIMFGTFCLMYFFINIIRTQNLHIIFYNLCLSLIMSGFVAFISFITNEKIGKADAIIFVLISLILNWQEMFILLCFSIFLSALFGIFVILYRRIKSKNLKNICLPFIPFIAVTLNIIIINKYGVKLI